jgi:wyosine [tRNA(Phe)-imidazoG37] synthetase (radical SAM superfamily)
MSRFTFGPVPSRRLGFSLGVDIIPVKTCSYDCIYCQIGRTRETIDEPRAYFDPAAVAEEVAQAAAMAARVDHITFSGSGEPTLNTLLGEMIGAVKARTSVPIAVITNGSLLYRADVRAQLAEADVVLPSFDGATEAVFTEVNRPHRSITLARVIEGLKALRRDFHGQIWLEIMLIHNINDSIEHINIISDYIRQVIPDRIQLTTVTRPPWHPSAHELGSLEMEKIASRLGDRCEVVSGFDKRIDTASADWAEAVADVLGRRSLSLEDVVRITGVEPEAARRRLAVLVRQGRARKARFRGKEYYLAGENRDNLC